MPTNTLSVKTQNHIAQFLNSIAEIDAREWNALAGNGQPFLRHEFLLALELSGCVAPAAGWTPRHIVVREGGRRALAAMPTYCKTHSRGEFVFDFSWANAYHQHGLSYYPKLLTAVPFTPVTGNRLLVRDGESREALETALIRAGREAALSEGLSSWHVLFPTNAESQSLKGAGLILRRDCQFHWFNAGYESFDAFLATFTAEKRKKAKRERRRVAEAGIDFDTRLAGDIDAALWKVLYSFYADTFHRHGHRPYLNLDFFKRIAAAMPESMMLKIARVGAQPIAVAIFFQDADALYGRYWGAGGNFHSLHFETCYYQGIEYCIERGLKRFEPGTQGEHKVPRGFVPSFTTSAHFIADKRFAAAIRDFAARESQGVGHYAASVNEHLPFHREQDSELKLPT
jgi:uncharacterized protein